MKNKAVDVRIPQEVYDKIMFFVDLSDVEVSLMGKVVNKDGYLEVKSVYLPEQVNSAAETDMDAASLGKLMFESKDDEGDLNCWIHSHVNMGVGWSGTDVATTKQIGAQGYCLSIVFNKRREYTCCYFQKGDGFRADLLIDNLEIKITRPSNVELEAEWTRLFKERCKAKVYALPKNSGYGYGYPMGLQAHTPPSILNQQSLPMDSSFFDGEIHKIKHGLRWSSKQSKWIKYKHYIKEDLNYDRNILDITGQRAGILSEYIQEKGVVPSSDHEINDYYLDNYEISFFDFYPEEGA